MDIPGLLAGSGFTGAAAVIAYGVQQLRSGIKEHRNAPAEASKAAVTDTTAANTSLIDTIEALHSENARLYVRIGVLEANSDAKDRKLTALQESLAEAQEQIHRIAEELEKLREIPQ